MPEVQWYYESNGQQAGPTNWDALLLGLKLGKISEDTRVWAPHLTEWTSLGTCMRLQNSVVSAPPVTVPAPEKEKTAPKSNRIIMVIISLFILYGLGTWGKSVLPSLGMSAGTKRTNIAWDAVKGNLRSPSTARWEKWNSWDLKKYEAYVYHFELDSQNGFGAMIRGHGFAFIYKSKSTGEWKVGPDVSVTNDLGYLTSDQYVDLVISSNLSSVKEDLVPK